MIYLSMGNKTLKTEAIIQTQAVVPAVQPSSITLSFIDVIVAIGVVSVIGGLIYIGRKLQILDDLKITTDKIKANVKIVGDFLARDNANFNSAELQEYSPLKLTPIGEEFIKTSGFANIFEANKDDFFKCIESEKPKLKYDVEIAAIKSISILYDKEYMNFLKVLFYNSPSRKMENTAPTFGVYIRDKYLSEHPEITQ